MEEEEDHTFSPHTPSAMTKHTSISSFNNPCVNFFNAKKITVVIPINVINWVCWVSISIGFRMNKSADKRMNNTEYTLLIKEELFCLAKMVKKSGRFKIDKTAKKVPPFARVDVGEESSMFSKEDSHADIGSMKNKIGIIKVVHRMNRLKMFLEWVCILFQYILSFHKRFTDSDSLNFSPIASFDLSLPNSIHLSFHSIHLN